MKVTLEKDYRRFYTLEDVDHAKAVIAYEKDNDDEKPDGWAKMLVNEIGKYKDFGYNTCREILKVTANTAKNRRAWNLYGDTYDMDVWIEVTAETEFGFVKAGAYLSDIWQTGAVEYGQHVYAEIYVRR